MRDMNSQELEALNGLIAGDLDPLCVILENENDALHPLLQRWLLKLIRGSSSETDFRLTASTHPDLKRASDGARHQRLASLTSLRVAKIVAQNGGFERQQTAGAFQAAMDVTGLSERTVKAHWARHKSFLRVMVARGLGANVKGR